MKQFIKVGIALMLGLCGVLNNTQAQNNPIFFGGSSDGYQQQNYSQGNTSDNPFKGGMGDGADDLSYLQSNINNSVYRGGMGDGVSKEAYKPLLSVNLFAGGIGDGFSDSGYAQIYIDMRKGGAGDGNADTGYLQEYVDVRMGGDGDGWASTVIPLTPLPLNLLSFTGEQKETQHILRWVTSREVNTAYFSLERSATSSNFVLINNITTSGNSSIEQQYKYIDVNPLDGNNFYRLKMVDVDGKYTYSNIVLLRQLKDNALLKIYPNPTASILNIELSGKTDNKEVLIDIYDAAARLVQRKTIRKDDNLFSVDVQSLAAGVYSMRIIDQGQISVLKFIKR